MKELLLGLGGLVLIVFTILALIACCTVFVAITLDAIKAIIKTIRYWKDDYYD